MTLTTRQIEDTDGLITSPEDAVDTYDDSLTAEELIDGGLESPDATELITLRPAVIEELTDSVDDLTDWQIQVLTELSARVDDNFGLVSSLEDGWDVADAWRELGYEATQVWRDRHNADMFAKPMPQYESVDADPASAGAVGTQILSDWVVELAVYEPDDYNPEIKTVTAKATERFRINSVKPRGFSGTLYDEPAWELEGLGDHDGEKFAIAPLEYGEDFTMWVWDSFNEEWDSALAIASVKTWPDKYAWEEREDN